MNDEQEFQKILNYALFLLNRRSYSSFNLQQKITQKFPEYQHLSEKVLAELKRLRLLDDQKYAIDYIRYRSAMSPRGQKKLEFELKNKGIAAEIITKVLEDFDEAYFARLAGAKKMTTFTDSIPLQKQKEKLMRFLISRGFKVGIAYQLVHELFER